jgi:hypothetical protein
MPAFTAPEGALCRVRRAIERHEVLQGIALGR